MQLRSLSSTSFWVEMPLSKHTCLLLWDAMADSGLRYGKINSYKDGHFDPKADWHEHLIEGRTGQGFFAPNALIQARLTAQDGGTLVEFFSANIRRRGDLGMAARAKRHIVRRVEEFLRAKPADWQGEIQFRTSDIAPPIASPFVDEEENCHRVPSFGPVVAFYTRKFTLKELFWLAAMGLSALVAVWSGFLGPALFVASGWELWMARRQSRKINWLGFSLTSAMAIFYTWGLVQPWL